MINGRTNAPLHILIIPSWYKTPETPVLGTFFEEQARALQRQGIKVAIIYPEYVPFSEGLSLKTNRSFDFYVDNNIPTLNVKINAGIPKMRRMSYHRFGRAVNRVYEDYINNFGKPDIIHAHSVFHAGICARYISGKHKIPLVITEHLTAYLMGYINSSADIEIARKIFLESDASIIVSHNFKKDLEYRLKLPDGTFKVIHNLVNDLFFKDFKTISYTNGETFRFFTNSFLLPRKNINLVIEAVRILLDKHYKISLSVGGDGPEEDKLKTLAADLGIADKVAFKGKLFRNEVKKELDDCHCFVLGSQYETFGVVLIESLACGRPVVTTDSGGPRDFVGQEQGIIVKDQTPQSLAEGMEFVINNYHKYQQQQLSEYCRERFSEQKIIGEIINVYKTILHLK